MQFNLKTARLWLYFVQLEKKKLYTLTDRWIQSGKRKVLYSLMVAGSCLCLDFIHTTGHQD